MRIDRDGDARKVQSVVVAEDFCRVGVFISFNLSGWKPLPFVFLKGSVAHCIHQFATMRLNHLLALGVKVCILHV